MSRQDFGGRECRRMTQGKPDMSARVVSRSVARSAIWTTSGITAPHWTRKADCPGGSTALDFPLSRPSATGLSPSLAGRATAKLRSREHTGRPAGTIQSAPTPPWNREGSEGHIAGARTSEFTLDQDRKKPDRGIARPRGPKILTSGNRKKPRDRSLICSRQRHSLQGNQPQPGVAAQ